MSERADLVRLVLPLTPLYPALTTYSCGTHILSLSPIFNTGSDGMSCFARVAANATAIEMDRAYCKKLAQRQEAVSGGNFRLAAASPPTQPLASVGRFDIVCSMYERGSSRANIWDQLMLTSVKARSRHMHLPEPEQHRAAELYCTLTVENMLAYKAK